MKITVKNYTTGKTYTRDLTIEADKSELFTAAMRCEQLDILDQFGGIIYTTCTIAGAWHLIDALM